MNDNIYSVSQLNQAARLLLERQLGQVWLTGEISNFSQPVSGHWYLSLKDENAQVRCAMFRMKNLRVNFRPANGMQVLVRASVSLYEPRGDYQLIIESMQMAGEGLLMQQFEALKMKLAAEGLFAQHHKQPLPAFSKTVGVVTSATGAALQDILQVLQRRDPSLKIVIYPTQVQGKEAAAEIAQMIELANQRAEVDVLIVGRGGGSLEDLWCFNEEIVARAIFHSQIPVISAVGHEIDVTIADFVADVRAPTPSAAAELVSRDQSELLQQLVYRQQRLEMGFDRLFSLKSQRLEKWLLRLQNQHPQVHLQAQQRQIQFLRHRLQQAMQNQWQKTFSKQTALLQRFSQIRPLAGLNQQLQSLEWRLLNNPLPLRLQRQQQQIQQLDHRLLNAIQKNTQNRQQKMALLCGKLDSLSPLKVLARGYSVTLNAQNQALTSSQQLQLGERLTTHLQHGQVVSQVVEIKE